MPQQLALCEHMEKVVFGGGAVGVDLQRLVPVADAGDPPLKRFRALLIWSLIRRQTSRRIGEVVAKLIAPSVMQFGMDRKIADTFFCLAHFDGANGRCPRTGSSPV